MIIASGEISQTLIHPVLSGRKCAAADIPGLLLGGETHWTSFWLSAFHTLMILPRDGLEKRQIRERLWQFNACFCYSPFQFRLLRTAKGLKCCQYKYFLLFLFQKKQHLGDLNQFESTFYFIFLKCFLYRFF